MHYTIDLNELISSKFTDAIFYAAKRMLVLPSHFE